MAAKNIKLFIICILISIVLIPDRIVVINRLKVDFASFLFAGKALSKGMNIYDYKTLQMFAPDEKFHVYPYLYTPVLAILMNPLTSLSDVSAQNIWSLINLLFYSSAIFILFKFAEIHKIVPKVLNIEKLSFLRMQESPIHKDLKDSNSRSNDIKLTYWKASKEYLKDNFIWFEPIIAIFLLELVLPYRYIFYMGQIDLIIFTFIILSLYFLKDGKEYSAGLSLSFAALLKISPAIFILYLVARKNYKAVVGFGFGSIILFVASSIFGGWNTWMVFFNTHLLNFAISNKIYGLTSITDKYNFSVLGVLSKLFPECLQFDRAISYILILALSVLAFVKTRKYPNKSTGLLLFSILCIIAMPFSWRQHLIYLMPGLFLYYLELKDSPFKKKILGLIPVFILTAVISFDWITLSDKLLLKGTYHFIFSYLSIFSIVIFIFFILYCNKYISQKAIIQNIK